LILVNYNVQSAILIEQLIILCMERFPLIMP